MNNPLTKGEREFLSYLPPESVARLACTCRRFAWEEGHSSSWRHAAWHNYAAFCIKPPQAPRRTHDDFEWWSVEPSRDVAFPRKNCWDERGDEPAQDRWYESLRGLLKRPAALKYVCLAGAQAKGYLDENFRHPPISTGGILAEIAHSKATTLEHLDLSKSCVTPAALEECLRLLPNLRSLVFGNKHGYSNIVHEEPGGAFIGIVDSLSADFQHPNLEYIRPAGQMHLLTELPRLLRHFPKLRVLDCSEIYVDPELSPDLYRHLTSLLRDYNLTRAPESPPSQLTSVMLGLADKDMDVFSDTILSGVDREHLHDDVLDQIDFAAINALHEDLQAQTSHLFHVLHQAIRATTPPLDVR